MKWQGPMEDHCVLLDELLEKEDPSTTLDEAIGRLTGENGVLPQIKQALLEVPASAVEAVQKSALAVWEKVCMSLAEACDLSPDDALGFINSLEMLLKAAEGAIDVAATRDAKQEAIDMLMAQRTKPALPLPVSLTPWARWVTSRPPQIARAWN